MNRQESFEKHWAQTHDVPVETMAQYRWKDQDGYRLPGMATAYRNFCAGWDAFVKNTFVTIRPFSKCVICGEKDGHGGLPCPKFQAESITITGVPYSD